MHRFKRVFQPYAMSITAVCKADLPRGAPEVSTRTPELPLSYGQLVLFSKSVGTELSKHEFNARRYAELLFVQSTPGS